MKAESAAKEPKYLVQYRSADGQEIKLSFEIVRKFLVSGRSEFVTDSEIMVYAGQCKARGLNPFKKDCYLVKYTKDDPAATIVSIDYYRSRAKAQKDCQGWTSGIIVQSNNKVEYREGSFLVESEKLLGGWFRAKPAGWEVDRTWTVSLSPYVKTTRFGNPTQFWSPENQPAQIAKVAESQGLRRCWPDEFSKLYLEEEIMAGLPSQDLDVEMPKRMSQQPGPGEDAQDLAEPTSDPQVEGARQPVPAPETKRKPGRPRKTASEPPQEQPDELQEAFQQTVENLKDPTMEFNSKEMSEFYTKLTQAGKKKEAQELLTAWNNWKKAKREAQAS